MDAFVASEAIQTGRAHVAEVVAMTISTRWMASKNCDVAWLRSASPKINDAIAAFERVHGLTPRCTTVLQSVLSEEELLSRPSTDAPVGSTDRLLA